MKNACLNIGFQINGSAARESWNPSNPRTQSRSVEGRPVGTAFFFGLNSDLVPSCGSSGNRFLAVAARKSLPSD